jgi:hypothetical protein
MRRKDICLHCGWFKLVVRKYPDLPEGAFGDIANSAA